MLSGPTYQLLSYCVYLPLHLGLYRAAATKYFHITHAAACQTSQAVKEMWCLKSAEQMYSMTQQEGTKVDKIAIA
jgi:hypothetical protein